MSRVIQKKPQSGAEGPEESIYLSTPTRNMRSKVGETNCRSVSTLAKGLADENRLRILLCLSNTKKSVTSIVEELGLSQPLVSHHLKELKRCLLVTIERSGPFIYYMLADSRTLDVVGLLDSLAADLVTARKTI
jgi:DNA-binding transcriptional ArsR family regulator